MLFVLIPELIGFEQYTDKEIVSKILAHDQLIIEYFFLKKCSPVFMYILHSVFDGKIDVKELINELLLYLSENNWHKLRQFDYRSRLTTWVRVVAVRFFVKKRNELIERGGYSALNTMKEQGFTPHAFMDRRMDLQKALNAMPNERYRKVIVALDLKEMTPEQLAKEMGITVDNLYNVHRRALLQLRCVMGRKEDYYD